MKFGRCKRKVDKNETLKMWPYAKPYTNTHRNINLMISNFINSKLALFLIIPMGVGLTLDLIFTMEKFLLP